MADYSNEKILKLAKEDELDIAIDLKGYTQNTRIELLISTSTYTNILSGYPKHLFKIF